MRVTYLYQFFVTPKWPGATRAYEFARRLVQNGHEVNMVTSNSGWTGMKLNLDDSPPTGLTEEDGIRVHWLDVNYSNKMGFLRRIAAFFIFSFRAFLKALCLETDVIFATSPPLTIGLPAYLASCLKRKPLVFEVRDRWPEAAIQLGVIRNPLLILAAEWFEKLLYRKARQVIVLTPGVEKELINAGVSPDKISVIPNSCDLDLFSDPGGPIERGPPFDFGDKFVLTYCGVHGPANRLDYLLDCAAACRKEGLEKVLILLVGDGKEKQDLQNRAARENLSNVLFMDPVAKTDIPTLFAASNIGLTILAEIPILWTGSPNKFFDTLAAGRPVLTNVPGWLAEMTEANGAGIYCDPKDPWDMVRKLKPMIENYTVWEDSCRRARCLGEKEFSRDRLSSKLEAALNSAVVEIRKAS